MQHVGYKQNGWFVDVGAFNCVNWSNTLMLSEAGWHGILIEPLTEFFDECVSLHGDNPKIILENCCVSWVDGTVKLYLGGSNSTINPDAIDIYNDIDGLNRSGLNKDNHIVCECRTLNSILDEHGWEPPLDVLSVDVEKAEIPVLGGFDIGKWLPKLAIVETHAMHPDWRLRAGAGEIDDLFAPLRYWKCYEDHINTVYVRNDKAVGL
jgi:FkbM family methyltransferase